MLSNTFFSGLSGLQSHSLMLNVAGNNLANVNTTGFKRGNFAFSQVMANSMNNLSGANNPMQIGLGARPAEISPKFEQGTLQTTGVKTQVAIQGNGFFSIRQGDRTAFTRSGNFSFDNEGFLVSGVGGRVQGYTRTDANGNVDPSLGLSDIQIREGNRSGVTPTSLVRFAGNLEATAPTGEVRTMSVEIFDVKGIPHALSVSFEKTANAGEWTYRFNVDDGEFNPPPPAAGDPAPYPASGLLQFDGSGNLGSIGPVGGPFTVLSDPGSADVPNIRISNLSSGASDLLITWDIEDDTAATSGQSFLTSQGIQTDFTAVFQDGDGGGFLQDIEIAQDGSVYGFYSNGNSVKLAQLALATFGNNHGLRQLDGNLFIPTNASGVPSYHSGNLRLVASMISGALENANVDVAEEFTTIIVGQRGYQANSRTISNTDQLIQEAINIKR